MQEIDVLLFLKSEPKVVDSSSLVHVLVDDLLGEITGQALLHVGLPGLHILLGDLELILGVVGLNLQHENGQDALVGPGGVALCHVLHLRSPYFVEIPPCPASLYPVRKVYV